MLAARDLQVDLEGLRKKCRKFHLYWCRPGTFQVDLEGTVEKVQESSPVLVQARDLPGGPRKYYRKSAGKFTCTGAGQEPSRWT